MFSKLDENSISMNIISSVRPKHTHKNAKKTTPRPIVIALLKHSAKEKILAEDSRGNTHIMCRKAKIRMTSYFLLETMQTETVEQNLQSTERKKNLSI